MIIIFDRQISLLFREYTCLLGIKFIVNLKDVRI